MWLFNSIKFKIKEYIYETIFFFLFSISFILTYFFYSKDIINLWYFTDLIFFYLINFIFSNFYFFEISDLFINFLSIISFFLSTILQAIIILLIVFIRTFLKKSNSIKYILNIIKIYLEKKIKNLKKIFKKITNIKVNSVYIIHIISKNFFFILNLLIIYLKTIICRIKLIILFIVKFLSNKFKKKNEKLQIVKFINNIKNKIYTYKTLKLKNLKKTKIVKKNLFISNIKNNSYLRNNKNFLKSKFIKIISYCKSIVFFCLLLNIITLNLNYYVFYNISINYLYLIQIIYYYIFFFSLYKIMYYFYYN